MLTESTIGDPNHILVKFGLRNTGLIATNQKNRPPFQIEGESDAPRTLICIEAKLLHIRVSRTFQRIYFWSGKVRTENRQ